jgi:hypothetical protein
MCPHVTEEETMKVLNLPSVPEGVQGKLPACTQVTDDETRKFLICPLFQKEYKESSQPVLRLQKKKQ